ncbi:spore cortex-lytic enzyme-like [Mytilus trossulus]|uniref:spore cortex-lytic enzyme-like n=1 Tax=Mytilus trossulus TaxID=6551 RepID=UPI0030063E53
MSSDEDIVGRVVFGESRGEPIEGQRAVAYTIVNRTNHPGFPNSVWEVANQRTASGGHQYETLDLDSHNSAWNDHKRGNTQEYRNAMSASRDALSRRKPDPTNGATSFNQSPGPNKTRIENHYFYRY